MGQSALVLKDMIGVYHMARSGGLSSGIKSAEGFDVGISEFIEKSKIDLAALDIRCKVQSFLSAADVKRQDYLVYTDKGERIDARVAFSKDVIDECDFAIMGGDTRAITEEGRQAIKRNIVHYETLGRKMLVFITCNGEQKCFVGAIAFCEGVDTKINGAINALKKSGVKIISFSNCIGRNATEIPEALMSEKRVSAGAFIKRELPITHDFGKFEQYCYLDEKMIADLAKYVKAQGKTLGVLGFTDYASDAVAEADVFITCSPVRTGVFGHFSEEIRSLEIPGEQSSSSCTQVVKSTADVLLMRPNNGKGGMEPLWRVVEFCKVAYRNLKNYMTYLMLAQLVRIVIVLLPMFFGRATVSAIQMVLFSLVFDVLVMLVMMEDTRKSHESTAKIKNEFAKMGFVEFLKTNFELCVSLAAGCGATIILSNVFGFLPFLALFDAYTSEFMYMALVGLSVLTFIAVYCGNLKNKQAYMRLVHSYAFIAYAALILLITTFGLLIRYIGVFFGLGGMPWQFFLLSLIPTVAATVCYFVMTEIKERKMQKSENQAR
jgi:hypothetical protein